MRTIMVSTSAAASANNTSVHGSMSATGNRRNATITWATLRNTASDTQPACSDSGIHCHHGPRAWPAVSEACQAAASRHARLAQMTSSASQNHCCENTIIHAEVSAKPAAVRPRIRRSAGVACRSNSCRMPKITSSAKIGPQMANA